MKKHVIDATNKRVGRVATTVATILMGKDKPDYQANVFPSVSVHITNTSKADISEKKKDLKRYSNYSGYPGGLKKPTMKQVIEKKGYSEVFEKAVYGMLPSNKLRSRMMKNLTITE